MKKIFELSKQNILLAKDEILTLIQNEDHTIFGNLLIVEDNSKILLEKRLGMCHSIYELLFICSLEKLETNIINYDWNSIYKKNFCVRMHETSQSSEFEKEIGAIISKLLKEPKVNLKNPETRFDFFVKENTVIAGKLLNEVDKSYLERKAHLRPSMHPTSMHPAIIRACINLTGLKNGKLLDPFCGSGGILIEAGLMEFNIIGYDIDSEQLKRAKTNLDHYNIKNYELSLKDATQNDTVVDAIVTDLPYGKGSKLTNLNELSGQFLNNAERFTKNAVVVFPDFANHRQIISKTKWKIEKEFTIYIHKSLSRVILKIGL